MTLELLNWRPPIRFWQRGNKSSGFTSRDVRHQTKESRLFSRDKEVERPFGHIFLKCGIASEGSIIRPHEKDLSRGKSFELFFAEGSCGQMPKVAHRMITSLSPCFGLWRFFTWTQLLWPNWKLSGKCSPWISDKEATGSYTCTPIFSNIFQFLKLDAKERATFKRFPTSLPPEKCSKELSKRRLYFMWRLLQIMNVSEELWQAFQVAIALYLSSGDRLQCSAPLWRWVWSRQPYYWRCQPEVSRQGSCEKEGKVIQLSRKSMVRGSGMFTPHSFQVSGVHVFL